MRTILGITNDLPQALQRKDQHIVNAMALLQLSKGRLQTMRESGWITLLNVTSSFCEKHEIAVHNMDDLFVPRGGKRRKAHKVTNLHHFRFEIFNSIIDMQVIELDARFPKSTAELLLCVACLNPSNLFSSFDKEKLIHMAEFEHLVRVLCLTDGDEKPIMGYLYEAMDKAKEAIKARIIRRTKDALDPISLENIDVLDDWVSEKLGVLDEEDIAWEIIEPPSLEALTLDDQEPNFDDAADDFLNENESQYDYWDIGGHNDPYVYVE
ncbi:hypothetical protein RHMOL_Rhmol08G0223500 [Rhododendron molle]|uniref:Uncharacterized protein n=1 Tax=Rhododendron molle TaxID=49168 RepID=A0ACC0MRF4_RHOML|nr:hypothetical protein RHMOL_Rhmol08G0223500 [Rhododendron molle]